MKKDIFNSYLHIDTARLRANIDGIIASLPEGTQLIPVLKCNAYGFGVGKVAGIMADFPAVQTIALAQVSEGVELRREGWQKGILITGAAATEAQREAAAEGDMTLTAYSADFIRALAATARRLGKAVDIHIKINTGLNRLGFRLGKELEEGIAALCESADVLRVSGCFTHFTEMETPDEIETEKQFDEYMAALEQLRAAGINVGIRHVCASAGYEFHPEMALDAVRLGRRLYYDNPVRPDGGISEAASWRAVITDVRLRKAGDRLGYGEGYPITEDTKVAMLGVGYGDGLFNKVVAAKAPVLVNGKRAKLISCCMDQCFLDVTGIDCALGDEAVLFGYDKCGNYLPAQEVASLMDDEACTLTAALGPRVQRIYE